MKIVLGLVLFSVVLWASPQGVPVQSTTTCGTTPALMLAANPNRGYLLFQNQGSDTSGHCRFKAGAIMVSGVGLWVDSGQNYETVEAYTKKAWYCQCDNDSQTIEILETNW